MKKEKEKQKQSKVILKMKSFYLGDINYEESSLLFIVI
jgi:hypothetical protein